MTRITTSPSRIYRERSSPMRVLTPSSRIYRRDINSPTRVVTSPARIVSIRVRPSVLSREFDRIDRKYRSSPIGVNDTEEYLNSAYSMVSFCVVKEREEKNSTRNFSRTSTTKHVISVHQQEDWWEKSTSLFNAPKACPVTDGLRACNQLTADSTPIWSTNTETSSLTTSFTSTSISCDQHVKPEIRSKSCQRSSTPIHQDVILVS